MIFLPSTAGSGSDVSQFAIITDARRRVKISLISRSLTPNVSIIDPDMLSTANDKLILSSAVDALAHAVESYVSLIAHPLTETLALKAIHLILENIFPALKDWELEAHIKTYKEMVENWYKPKEKKSKKSARDLPFLQRDRKSVV